MSDLPVAAARRLTLSAALGSAIAVFLGGVAQAQAQALTVLPVNLTLSPGQLAGTLTVINRGTEPTSVQVRALSWRQTAGTEELTPSDAVLISPPIATIAPGASQVVRLVLRHPESIKEGTFRILLDQIPPAASPGTVRIALRLSIPVFAEPQTRAASHLAFRVETEGGHTYLVAANDGGKHETIRNIELSTSAGAGVAIADNASPYILAGGTQRWSITGKSAAPAAGSTLHLKAQGDSGAINTQVAVLDRP
jgi:fimbrial chaperone protein